MQRLAMIPLAAALTLALAAPGFAQAPAASAPTKAPAPATDKAPPPSAASASPAAPAAPATPATPAAPESPSLQSQLEANSTHPQTNKKFEVIKAKGGMTSAQARAKADAKLAAASKKADADAAKGEATVAARLAAEFGMTAEDLLAERQTLGCSWGDLMIARSFRAMSTTEISAADLLELHKDTGWAQIAAGLGLKLGEAVAAVQAEERVAAGLAEPDGKVAAIPPGTRAHGSSRSAAGTAASGSQTAAQAATKDKP